MTQADIEEVEKELRRLFEKCGNVVNLVAKRNRNSEYCFAFVEMKDHAAALECVKKLIIFNAATTKAPSAASRSKSSSKMTPNAAKIQSTLLFIAAKAVTTVERWVTSRVSATLLATTVRIS